MINNKNDEAIKKQDEILKPNVYLPSLSETTSISPPPFLSNTSFSPLSSNDEEVLAYDEKNRSPVLTTFAPKADIRLLIRYKHTKLSKTSSLELQYLTGDIGFTCSSMAITKLFEPVFNGFRQLMSTETEILGFELILLNQVSHVCQIDLNLRGFVEKRSCTPDRSLKIILSTTNRTNKRRELSLLGFPANWDGQIWENWVDCEIEDWNEFQQAALNLERQLQRRLYNNKNILEFLSPQKLSLPKNLNTPSGRNPLGKQYTLKELAEIKRNPIDRVLCREFGQRKRTITYENKSTIRLKELEKKLEGVTFETKVVESSNFKNKNNLDLSE